MKGRDTEKMQRSWRLDAQRGSKVSLEGDRSLRQAHSSSVSDAEDHVVHFER